MRIRIALVAVAALLGAACSGGDDTGPVESAIEAATPTPAPVGATPTPGPDPVDETSTAPPEPTTAPATPVGTPDPAAWVLLEPDPVSQLPHDTEAFTQGLVLENGRLFESTGLRGRSTLRELDPDSGEILRSVDLDDDYFAEGLELVGDRLIQLTFQEEVAFVYDVDTFEPVGSFDYAGEGWGLCDDGEQLVMSNGSSELTFRDLETFEPTGEVTVTFDGSPLNRLNELECVDGSVWANVWLTDTIVRVDPATGIVTGVVDASGLLPERPAEDGAVLNGIAYDDATGQFLLTGRLWPTIFAVELVELERR